MVSDCHHNLLKPDNLLKPESELSEGSKVSLLTESVQLVETSSS